MHGARAQRIDDRLWRGLVLDRRMHGDAFMLFRSRIGAVILIVIGTFFLLSNLGWIPQLGPLFHKWWPLILIMVGVLLLVRRV